MTKTLAALMAATITFAAAMPADAGNARSANNRAKTEWRKMDETGGYGNPLFAVPAAIADAMSEMVDTMTGSDEEQTAESPKTTK